MNFKELLQTTSLLEEGIFGSKEYYKVNKDRVGKLQLNDKGDEVKEVIIVAVEKDRIISYDNLMGNLEIVDKKGNLITKVKITKDELSILDKFVK